MARSLLVVVLGLAVCAGCAKSEGKAAPAPADPIGKVSAVTGTVTARRAIAAPRPLAVSDPVFADDTVTTGVGASLTLDFTAHGGHWELGAERSRALSEVVAQLASLGAGEAHGQDVTAAAGRHAEGEAADTAGTAKPGTAAPEADQAPLPDDGDKTRSERKAKLAEQVKSAGLLKILGAKGGGGTGDVFDGDQAIGGEGIGGLGLKGTGPGGGGTGEGTIGIGNLGTIGKGGGGARKGPVGLVSDGTAATMGSLDKEIIRRVVRQHRAEVRYCYERELAKNPNLEGTISVTFIIGAQGSVVSAKVQTSTVSDPDVGTCLVGRVKSWMFPKPAPGIVTVTYPFVLKTGG